MFNSTKLIMGNSHFEIGRIYRSAVVARTWQLVQVKFCV